MKKIPIIFGLVILTITSEAQINLEHTFTSTSNYGIYSFITDSKGIMYYTYGDTTTNQIKFYNKDYSLYKTITINRPVGYSIIIFNVSEKLFNINSSLELLCEFSKAQNTKLLIYDENGTIIKDFGTYNYGIYPYIISNGLFSKLIIKALSKNSSSQLIDEIYSLPGNLPNTALSTLKFNIEAAAYPNPANKIIYLPYKLEYGKSTILRIYNLKGQLIEQKNIDSNDDKVILDLESYQPGIYFYEYNGITNKFILH